MRIKITEQQRNFLFENIINESTSNDMILSTYLKNNNLTTIPIPFTTMATMPTNDRVLYKFGENILKITESALEYENAKKLVEKPLKGFIKYFDAQPIGDKYVLVMEQIEDLSQKQADIIDYINNSLGVSEYMLDKYRIRNFKNEIRRYPDYYEYLNVDGDTILWYLSELQKMYRTAKENGIELFDLRAQNLGWNNNYELVHFDLGGV